MVIQDFLFERVQPNFEKDLFFTMRDKSGPRRKFPEIKYKSFSQLFD